MLSLQKILNKWFLTLFILVFVRTFVDVLFLFLWIGYQTCWLVASMCESFHRVDGLNQHDTDHSCREECCLLRSQRSYYYKSYKSVGQKSVGPQSTDYTERCTCYKERGSLMPNRRLQARLERASGLLDHNAVVFLAWIVSKVWYPILSCACLESLSWCLAVPRLEGRVWRSLLAA